MSWKVVTLGEIAEINPRTIINHISENASVTVVPMSAVSENGEIITLQSSQISDIKKGLTVFQENDVLLAKITPCMENGKRAIARGLENGIGFGSTEFHVVRTKKDVLPEYIFYFIGQKSFREEAELNMTGSAGQKRVPASFVKNKKLVLPPIETQYKIVSALVEADSLIRKRKEAIAKLDRLMESIFLDMFGDKINIENKDLVELGEVIITGPQNGLYKPSSDYGNGSPILRIDSFYDGRIKNVDSLKLVNVTPEELERYSLNEGDIVINRVNSKKFLGKSAIVTKLSKPTVFESNMMRFSVDSRVDPEYLIYFLQQPFIKRQIQSRSRDAVNQSSINQQDVMSLLVYVPEINLQKKFSMYSREINDQKSIMNIQLTKLEENFQSLLHQAFTGRLQFRESKVDEYALKR